MSKTLRESLRKTVAGVVAIATILSLSGVAALIPMTASAATIVDGDIIKSNAVNSDGTPTYASLDVYIVKLMGAKKFKRLILNPTVFTSYGHLKMANVKTVDQATMDSYTTSNLVRVDTDPAQKVFALVPNGDIGAKSWVNLTAAEVATVTAYDPESVYTINSVDGGNYTAVADVTTTAQLTTFFASGTLPSTVPSTGTLTVGLASDNPAAVTLVTDATDGSQALAPMVSLNFANGSSGAVKVTTLKFTRTGISADTDVSNAYLYDGSTRLAEMTSAADKIFTFTSASGLFTIPANGSKVVMVKIDVANSSTGLSGKTIGLSVNVAGDVVTDGAAVSGTFPISGNLMGTATVTDLGRLEIGSSTPTAPASVDPGVTNREIVRINAVASNQKLAVSYVKFTNVGTIATTDLANLKLMDGATQLGSTLTSLAADNTAVFDLSSAPWTINSGVTKNLTINADVVGGTNRNFKMTIQRQSDIVVKDTSYGVNVRPYTDANAETFATIAPTSATSINTGTLTISVDASSPTGNVAAASTGITLSKFKFVAAGEAVKISTLPIIITTTTATDIKNVKLMLDGTQIGSTLAYLNSATAATMPATVSSGTPTNSGDFGNSFIVPVGTTGKILSIVADISANASDLGAGDTIVASLNAGAANNAQGQTSLTNITTTASTGRTLTVASGALTPAKNLALANADATNPSGVAGSAGAKIGSFVLTAGAGEGVSVSQIQVNDEVDGGDSLADLFQNMRLMMGTTQVGSTIGTLTDTAGTTYTYTPATAITIAAGQQVVFDIVADIKTTIDTTDVNADSDGLLNYASASATGLVTNSSANNSTVTTLQNVYIASSGNLTITKASDSPTAQQVVMGTTAVPLAKFKFTQTNNSEDLNITQVRISDYDSASVYGSLSNVQLLDGTTVLGTQASLNSSGQATFTGLSLTIAKGASKTLTVQADITAYPGATANSTHAMQVAAAADVVGTGVSSGGSLTGSNLPIITATPVPTGSTMRAVRTKLTVAKDSASPSGTSGVSSEQTVAIFNFSNSSNIGNYDAKLSDLQVNIALGGASWGSTGTRSIKVYKDSVATANLIGQKDYSGGTVIGGAATGGTVAFEGWTSTTDSNPAANSLTDVTIASGSTTKIYITANTTGALSTYTLTASLNAGDVKWEDGVRTSTNAYTEVNSLPVAGGTLVY